MEHALDPGGRFKNVGEEQVPSNAKLGLHRTANNTNMNSVTDWPWPRRSIGSGTTIIPAC